MIKHFVLSYYNDATENFHITKITAPGEARNLHCHDYFQIYYVVSGSMNHRAGENLARLASGDVFILPPNLPHCIEETFGEVEFYSMSFLPAYFQKADNKLITDFLSYLNRVEKSVPPQITLNYEDSVFSHLLLQRILGEFSEKKGGSGEIIKESVSVILSLLARVYFEKQPDSFRAAENKQMVIHCVEYIKNHFNDDLTLEKMVRLSAVSKTCFCSIFTSLTGTTFKDYLNRYRVEKGAELLREGESVSSASIRCGYNDLSTFYRNFKKYKGVSPQNYSAKHIGGR